MISVLTRRSDMILGDQSFLRESQYRKFRQRLEQQQQYLCREVSDTLRGGDDIDVAVAKVVASTGAVDWRL